MSGILIINTGGTISMTASARGYAPDGRAFRSQLEKMKLLNAESMPEWDLVETEPLLDSSNMTVSDWNRIGGLVAENYDSYDGFVILHGTDTMAYTASALSFMLQGLDKPVILTGSQIPLAEIRSDGRANLIDSLLIAAEGRAREVCIFFGGKLLRGNRATKYSADELIAFVSPNYPALAETGITVTYNDAALLKRSAGKFELQLLD
jgi:L-asparaginase